MLVEGVEKEGVEKEGVEKEGVERGCWKAAIHFYTFQHPSHPITHLFSTAFSTPFSTPSLINNSCNLDTLSLLSGLDGKRREIIIFLFSFSFT